MQLYIIAGHGAGDPGACAGGYSEAERVRALASRIKALGGSKVTVLDTSRDWYADNGISSLKLPSDAQLLELHMDSASPSARGGHVVISQGLAPDAYDKALANFISSFFPGRSVVITPRGDLANPARAASRGFSYRLLEVCFISNNADREKFNNNLDTIAAGILKSFNLASTSAGKEKAMWLQEKTGQKRWWYRHADGSYTSNGWEKIDNLWYFFDKEGWMKTGWLSWKNNKYYLQKNSTKDFKEGQMRTGWVKINNLWYYFNSEGVMANKTCLEIDGKWYAFSSNGVMKTSVEIDSSNGNLVL